MNFASVYVKAIEIGEINKELTVKRWYCLYFIYNGIGRKRLRESSWKIYLMIYAIKTIEFSFVSRIAHQHRIL